MDLRLLALLSDGHFHSGERLGAELGITRAAVSKRLQQLSSNLSLPIERVTGKGYRLCDRLSLFDQSRLAAAVDPMGWQLILLDSVDSTSAECLRRLPVDVERPLLVLAESQTAGRGRRGRVWNSPACKNFYGSLAVRLRRGGRDLSSISLVVGLSVLRALEDLGIRGGGLKWPNDIYVRNQKIAGILLELSGDPSDECHLVIGIGINVNMRQEDCAIDQPWTSLRLEVGEIVDRNDVAAVVSERLAEHLKKFFLSGFAHFQDQWNKRHVWAGQECDLHSGCTTTRGVVLGVANDGALRMLVDGAERRFSAGELTLRRVG